MAKAAPVNVLQTKRRNEGLTQQEIADYRRVFNKFDKDKGGSIDANELGNLVRVLGSATPHNSMKYTNTHSKIRKSIHNALVLFVVEF